MPHPLQTQVASISRRAHRLVSAHVASRLVAITLGSVVILAGLDYLFRYQDRGLRIICTMALIAAVAGAVYRFLIPLLRSRQDDLATARRIERRFPLLGQRLSSSLQFLCEDEEDPKAGSSALRRAVIVEATGQVEPLELDDVLDRRPIWRALAVAVAVCVAAVLAWSADPVAARMGTMRLLNPLSDAAWPRETQLEFLTPITQVAIGESFEVTLLNRNGPLPRDVQIHFRQRANDRILTQEGLPVAGGKRIVRRENVREAFEYRAEGGDDRTMEWIAVAVVEPPQVDVPQITIIPPAYSGWPSRVSKASIRALRGSSVELQAVVNRPLRSAAVLLEGGRRIEAAISADGMSFSVASRQSDPWIIAEDRAYWFELVDREDASLIGGSLSKWEIRPLTDNRPAVDLQLPAAANVYVTREAIVRVRVVVQDDLAIRDAALVFTLADPSDEQASDSHTQKQQSISLYQGPSAVAKRQTSQDAAGEMLTLTHAWELAKLDLRPGMQIEYRAAASDYQPATGESPLRRLLIITTAQLESRIADRQSAIVTELARALRIERQSRAHVTSLEIQLKQIGHLNKADVDSLQAARQSQRQATRLLTAEGEGLVFQIEAMLDELRTNRIESRETTGRLTTLAVGIKSLADGPLPGIEHQLDRALSGAQGRLDQSPETPAPQADKHVAAAVGTAGKQQDQVIRSLASMLSEWSQWDNFRRLVRDLTEIFRSQQELRRGAALLGSDPQVIGRRTDELTPQQQADRLKLGHQQLVLARQLDAAETRMEQLIETLRSDKAAPVGMIADALDLSRTRATSSRMRLSARNIEENRIGQAQTVQHQVIGTLQEILDVLLSRREQNLSRLIGKLQQAENDLNEIQRKQQAVVKKTQPADQASGRRERQRAIADETESLMRRLRRLEARRAAKTLGNAAGGMNRAAEENDSNPGQQKQIAKDLEDAKHQLAQRRRESQADLVRDQMTQLADAMTGLIKRQTDAIAQTGRIETDRNTTGTVAWRERVDHLSGEQIAIGSDLHKAADRLTSSAVFELALQNTSGDIARAVELLRENETGVRTVKSQQRALGHMTRIVESLQSKPPDEPPPPDDADPDASDAKTPPAGQGKINRVEEFALLLAMQRDVNRRTMEMEQSRAKTGELTEQQKTEFDRLSEEQGRLADLFGQLTEKPEANNRR